MDIFEMCDKRHGMRIRCSGEDSSGNIFASSFLLKIEISPTHIINLKYDVSQEIWPRPTRPGDIVQQEIPKFAMYEE